MEIANDVGLDREAITKARLRVDTLKWVCARLNPGKYSDKISIEATVKRASHEDALAELDGPVIEQFPALAAPGLNGGHEQALDGLDKADVESA